MHNLHQTIITISQRFIKLKREMVDVEISNALGKIGEYTGVDRAYVFLLKDEGMVMQETHEWCREGVEHRIEFMQDVLSYQFPWLMRKLMEGIYINLPDTCDLPDEAENSKDFFRCHEVRSCLIIPLISEDITIGFIGFDAIFCNKTWDEETIHILRLFGDIINNSLKFKMEQEEIQVKLYDQSLLLDNTEVQIWYLKNLAVYGAVNNAHAFFFGKTREEMEYTNIYNIFENKMADYLSAEYLEVFEEKKQVRKEIWVTNGCGQDRVLYLIMTPKLDEYGNIEYVICTAEDITERKESEIALKKAKEAAEEVSRIKSQFLANMSHEIRTPLHGIIGMTEMMMGTVLTNEQEDHMRIIKLSSELLLNLVNDILDYSKLEAGKMTFESVRFNLEKFIDETVQMMNVKARQKGLTLSYLIENDAKLNIISDPGRVRQVLLNLIGNAIKFTNEGEIRVIVTKEGVIGEDIILKFSVTDTGIGISEEKIDMLFKVFSQLDNSNTRQYGGTGLGLAICKGFVEILGGTIGVTSKLGLGSNFYFTLPHKIDQGNDSVADQLSSEQNSPSQFKCISQKLSILLVEDNPVNQKLAMLLLGKYGWKVTPVENGQEAIDKYSQEEFDLVLMDVQMPVMDGLEATRRIRLQEEGTGRRTPIIAMTARSMIGDSEKCLEAGMDYYISKPIRVENLLTAIESVIQKEA